jgi:acylpyruvate hydrolase
VAHARELGNAVPTQSVLFGKQRSSLLSHGQGPIVIPSGATVHHEVELGVVIGKRAQRVSRNAAMDYVSGYCVALDMTARNWQDQLKKAGLPWDRAKGPDTFCPVGSFIARDALALPATVWCTVDGAERQRGSTSNMIWSVPELIEDISNIFTLEPGDLILTGTPEGVGPVLPGQTIVAGIEGHGQYEWKIVAASPNQ